MEKRFLFRRLPAGILLGTASDRHAGWIGQIYTRGRWEERISRRSHAVGARTYTEEILPVESVKEYFRHFPVLELDFWRPLLEWDGHPGLARELLAEYRPHLREEDLIVLGAPRGILGRGAAGGGGSSGADEYLNPEFYARQFHEPALKILGPHLAGIVFRQEYQHASNRVEEKMLAAGLDAFFSAIPRDDRYHIELRTREYLAPPVFDVLERHGVGQVLSHWTWLPRLAEQFKLSGSRFLNAGATCLIRLVTPRGRRGEDSWAMAFPFDRLVPGVDAGHMVEEAAALAAEAVARGVRVMVIIDNRAGGNAPLVAEMIADRLADIKG